MYYKCLIIDVQSLGWFVSKMRGSYGIQICASDLVLNISFFVNFGAIFTIARPLLCTKDFFLNLHVVIVVKMISWSKIWEWYGKDTNARGLILSNMSFVYIRAFSILTRSLFAQIRLLDVSKKNLYESDQLSN